MNDPEAMPIRTDANRSFCRDASVTSKEYFCLTWSLGILEQPKAFVCRRGPFQGAHEQSANEQDAAQSHGTYSNRRSPLDNTNELVLKRGTCVCFSRFWRSSLP